MKNLRLKLSKLKRIRYVKKCIKWSNINYLKWSDGKAIKNSNKKLFSLTSLSYWNERIINDSEKLNLILGGKYE